MSLTSFSIDIYLFIFPLSNAVSPHFLSSSLFYYFFFFFFLFLLFLFLLLLVRLLIRLASGEAEMLNVRDKAALNDAALNDAAQ